MLRDQTSLTAPPSATPRAAGGRSPAPRSPDLSALLEGLGLDASLELWTRDLLAVVLRENPECCIHSVSCASLTLELGRDLGWCGPSLRRLALGGLLHDVGKLSIPRRLLSKPGALSTAERNLVRRHTVVGSSILEAVALPDLDLAGEMARSHHERWDGGGYPDGLGGDEIPWAARIMAVVDVYDALRRPRAYRAALEEGDAIEVLRRGAGTQFDAEVLASFLDLVPRSRRDGPRPAVGFSRAARTPHRSSGRYRNQPRRQK